MVNTFVICQDAATTAYYLDDRRLGKQRVEALQIISTLEGKTKGYSNHPAVKMWVGHLDALKDYCNKMILEWIRRGKNNTMELFKITNEIKYPYWYNDNKIHFSHMSRLIQKDANFYCKFNPPKEYLNYGYIWPSKWTQQQIKEFGIEKLGEPFVQEYKCVSFTKSGIACSNKALYSDKCGVHKPKDWKPQICQGIKKSGSACTHKAKVGKVYCGVHNR